MNNKTCWNIFISIAPADHIGYLKQRGFDLKDERDRLEIMLETFKVTSKSDMDAAIAQLNEYHSNQIRDEIERIKLQGKLINLY